MERELVNTSLMLPRAVKKALALVAADMGSSPSELLRIAATEIVSGYRGGIFYRHSALDIEHIATDAGQ
ncbi:MAG: hypothetical protein JXB07_18810 [Anaerolineae bacterium]|nr:hypothetical protein [Anaerolineae bacterium]